MGSLAHKALFGGAIVAATGVPYALNQLSDSGTESAPPAAAASASPGEVDGVQSNLGPAPILSPPVSGDTDQQVAELFSFDRTHGWVISRWPRVITINTGSGLVGYRVPLVTGTEPGDLAGSLTYYFDSKQKLAQIAFQGATGDYNPLLSHLVERHGLRPQESRNPRVQLYRTHYDGKVRSQFTIETAPVLRADEAHRRYHLSLSLQHPPERRLLTESKQVPGIRWP